MPKINSLNPTWLTLISAPPSLSQDLEARIREMNDVLQEILALPKRDQPKNVVDRLKEIEALSQSTDKTIAQANNANWGNAAIKQLKAFEAETRIWRVAIPAALTDDLHANTRSRYTDAGGWAIHFSMVRMTVTTFLVAAAWGVISVKWNEYSWQLCWAAWAVWILGAMFLWLFTLGTSQKSRRQKELQYLLPTIGGADRTRGLSFWRWWLIWLPFVLYLAATVGFWLLTREWAKQENRVAIAWTALVENGSTAIPQTKASVRTVDLANWGTRLASIDSSLDAIKRSVSELKSLSLVTPIPTATATPTPGVRASPSPKAPGTKMKRSKPRAKRVSGNRVPAFQRGSRANC